MNEKIIGIMGAMHEEINSILHLMTDIEELSYGRRIYYTGTINNIKTVVVFSRWGKVAAATTVTSLITRFNITDMDARPLMPRHEIPLLGVTYFESDPNYIAIAKKAIDAIVGDHIHSFIDEHEIERFLLHKTRVFTGTIASGDRFFADQADKEQLHAAIPEILCVEMEGAAVAQVCYEYEIPFVVVRIISDECNENSSIDFPDFIQNVSSKYAYEIIRNMFAINEGFGL
jgi:adenosylhomocysteine nucleosidase